MGQNPAPRPPTGKEGHRPRRGGLLRWCVVCTSVGVVAVAAAAEGALHRRPWVAFVGWSLAWAYVSVRDWRVQPDQEYQLFLDTFPFSRFSLDIGQRAYLGPVRAERLPAFLGRFDWLVDMFPYGSRHGWQTEVIEFAKMLGSTPEVRRAADPAAVFAAPHAVRRLVAEIEGLPELGPRENRALVLGGTDMHLSRALGDTDAERMLNLAKLKRRFSSIRIEAKDADLEGVGSMPIGLAEAYYRRHDVPRTLGAIQNASLAQKPNGILFSAGIFFTNAHNCKRIVLIPSEQLACHGRRRATAWASSPEAQQVGVIAGQIPQEAWLAEMSTYRFLLSPHGLGIQSSKVIEALLVLTIPIVERGPYPVYDDLVNMGFPIVVVDDWTEVAKPGNLDRWYAELAPRLERFRQTCLTPEGYWRLATGQSGGQCGE